MSCGSTPTNTVTNNSQPPQQVLDAYQKLISAGQAQAQQPLQQYGGPMVAGFTPQQQQAFSTIQGAQGLAQPYINAGAQLVGQSAAPIQANGLITGNQLSGLASQGLGYTNNAANTGIAAAGAPGVNMATAAGGSGAGIAGQAGAAANAAAGTDPSNVSKYFNPYLNSAVSATQAEFNNQNAQTAQGITSNAIKSGAFGGDRADVAQGIASGQEQLAQAPVIAGMESQGYSQAQQAMAQQEALQAGTALSAGNLGLSGAQLGTNAGLGIAGLGQQAAGQQGQLGLSAAQQLYGLFGGQQQTGLAASQASGWLGENAGAQMAGLGSASENAALTGASANLQAGQQQQAQAQQQLNIPYEQFLARQAYPYQNLQFLAGLTTGAGSNAGGQSSTTSPGPSTLSQVGGAGLAGVGLIGATGGFGANGWLSGLGSSVGSMFKQGGAVGYDAGGTVPDVSVSYVPDLKTTRGGGPPKAPTATPQDDPMQQGLATMKDANSLKGLFSPSDPALAGKLRGISSTWDALAQSPDTYGNYLASKFGGRAGLATGGNPGAPYESANPMAQSSFSNFAGMPEEKLREMAVMMPPDSSQGQMIRRALQQKQMVPANDNNTGLAATGTNGSVTGLASGGVPAGMSFIPGARGISIPQVDATMFGAPSGLDTGGGLPGWYNPLPQLNSSGSSTGSSTITTPMPRGVLDVFNPPLPPPAVTVSTNTSAGSSSSDGPNARAGGSDNGGGTGGNADGGTKTDSANANQSSATNVGDGPANVTTGERYSTTPGNIGLGLGTAAGMGLGTMGLGTLGETIGDTVAGNNFASTNHTTGPTLGEIASAGLNNLSFGTLGTSMQNTMNDRALDGTVGNTGSPADRAQTTAERANQAAADQAEGASNRAEAAATANANADSGGGRGGSGPSDSDRAQTETEHANQDRADQAEGKDNRDTASADSGNGGDGHDSSDSGDKAGGRVGRTGLAEGGYDDEPGESLADAGPMPAGGIAATQPFVPDAHDAVDVKGSDNSGLAGAGPPAPPSAGLSAAAPTAPAGKTPEYQPGKPSPWMALLTAGAGAMAGRSPFALSNIGQGLLAGTKEYERENEMDAKPEVDHSGETVRIYYPSEKKWIDTGLPTNEAQRTKATSAEAKARLEQTGAYQTESLKLQGQRGQTAADAAAATQAYQKSELGLRREQLEQGKFTAQPVKDAMGNPIGTNLIDNKTGTVKFQPSEGVAKPASGDLTKTGEDFLQTLPADTQRTVKAIVEGRQAQPTSVAMSKPYWIQMMGYANQYDPTLDQTTWAARNKTRSAFATGQEAKNVTALNTTLQHAEVLNDTFDKLGNTSVPWANAVKNWVSTQAGSEAPTNARAAVSAVSSEARKVFAGAGGGGLAELENWEKNFPVNGSPEQQKGAIKQLVNLMDSRLNALGDQYNRGMSKADDPVALLSPEAQKSYTKLTGRAPNGTAIGGTGAHAEANGAEGLPSFANPADASKLPSGSAFYAVMPDGTKKLKYVP